MATKWTMEVFEWLRVKLGKRSAPTQASEPLILKQLATKFDIHRSSWKSVENGLRQHGIRLGPLPPSFEFPEVAEPSEEAVAEKPAAKPKKATKPTLQEKYGMAYTPTDCPEHLRDKALRRAARYFESGIVPKHRVVKRDAEMISFQWRRLSGNPVTVTVSRV